MMSDNQGQWPKAPYRGLGYFTEADARLFRERDRDVRNCAHLLLGFGVKFLILQGSSGTGKSSFLRAGLIPYLKSGMEMGEKEISRSFFLSGNEGVIRCTSDPLKEIIKYITAAVEAPNVFSNPNSEEDDLADDEVRGRVLSILDKAKTASRDDVAALLVDALFELAGNLPGKLILVLDQAEEVLLPATDQQSNNDLLRSFFRFLETMYVRNIDVRMVISLRTEFYGRFRSELRIPDDRLSQRPRSGGVEPYLLRSLRDREALVRAMEAPARARESDGKPVYDFKFQDGLIAEIVDDLLREFQHSSVTPALQVICAYLYDRIKGRSRQITFKDYQQHKGASGILRSYLDQGIRNIGFLSQAEVDKWYALLHSLVSRQGGGTVVSATVSRQVLVARAREQSIKGDIETALVKLNQEPLSLLRGDPPDTPQRFSLKHDILAVMLSRWHAEHDGAVEVKEANKKNFQILSTMIGALTIGIMVASFVIYDRSKAALIYSSRALTITNKYSEHEPTSDFRLALLIMVSNLDATKARFSENMFLDIFDNVMGVRKKNHDGTLDILRRTLPRIPWFSGHYSAVGFDPLGKRLALLNEGSSKLQVLNLPSEDAVNLEYRIEERQLPYLVGQSRLPPAVGFVDGLGPVAVIGNDLFFWNQENEPQKRDLATRVPAEMKLQTFWRVDFAAGRLQIIARSLGDKSEIRVMSLQSDDLLANPMTMPKVRQPIVEQVGLEPMPALSKTAQGPLLYAALQRTVPPFFPRDGSALHWGRNDADTLSEAPRTDLVVGPVDQSWPPVRLAPAPHSIGASGRDQLPATLAFAENRNALIFKAEGPQFDIIDFGENPPDGRKGYTNPSRQRFTVEVSEGTDPTTEWQVRPANLPFQYPPVAATQVGPNWRAAWLASDGVWAVESDAVSSNIAKPIHGGALMSGELGGLRMHFTQDGGFLFLHQQKRFNDPVQVRVWDLRPAWKDWIQRIDADGLRSVACRIVRSEGKGGSFTGAQAQLLNIEPSRRTPCPDPSETTP
jgi:hypothetical protein